MDRTQLIPRTIMDKRHEFYCDGEGCGKFLGYTTEYDDGYYPKLGEFECGFYALGKWWKIHKHLCDECKAELILKISDALLDAGFLIE